MTKFIIIEDCSPFYIRFTHEGIDKIIEYGKQCVPNLDQIKTFYPHRLPHDQAASLLAMTPLSDTVPLEPERVILFISSPGMYYRAHKDGMIDRCSFNYTVSVNDDKCVTSWYSDKDLTEYSLDPVLLDRKLSRECVGFDPANHTALKSMTAMPGECILFNTELFHDWNNTASNNYRVVLTLRIAHPFRTKTYFEDVKKLILGE